MNAVAARSDASPTPAGVGGTEAGLIGMFVVFGAPLAGTTAAVLAYRVLQLGLPALLSALAAVDLRRLLRSGPPQGLHLGW